MNCKQGDLAVVVRCDNPSNMGRLVKCTELKSSVSWITRDGTVHEGPAWVNTDGLPSREGRRADWMPDAYLRPIRDPGEDAQDESLSWLPVPSASKEVA